METESTELYLRMLVELSARHAFPEAALREIVAPTKNAKYLRAYNLCEGSKTQREIASQVGIDQGNFSRTIGRWIELGVLYRLGAGKEARLRHLYPIRATEEKWK